MAFKAGDKVRVTNVDKIMFGEQHFNEGDVTTIAHVEHTMFGPDTFVAVTKNEDDPDIQTPDPEHVTNRSLLFVQRELQFLEKVSE